VLGSNATHALGARRHRWRALAGDVLLCETSRRASRRRRAHRTVACARDDPIRVILGPQDDYFSRERSRRSPREFHGLASQRSDGVFPRRPECCANNGLSIVSDGIVMGAIQVLGDGRPMVLMADRQVTGGYPKIATVIGADLGRLAQMRPGTSVRFAVTTVDAAVAARREQSAILQAPIAATPLGRNTPSAELLLGSNLISGVSGGDPGAE
jgi:allophanate hydrolase subunit 2